MTKVLETDKKKNNSGTGISPFLRNLSCWFGMLNISTSTHREYRKKLLRGLFAMTVIAPLVILALWAVTLTVGAWWAYPAMALGWIIRIAIAYWITVQAFKVSDGRIMESVILVFLFIGLAWNTDVFAPHGWFTLGCFSSLDEVIQGERNPIVRGFFLGEATTLASMVIFTIKGHLLTGWIEKSAIIVATVAFSIMSVGTIFAPDVSQFAPPLASASRGFEVFVLDRAFPLLGSISACTFLICMFILATGKLYSRREMKPII